MTAFVCLDFPKFIAVKMRSTLKPYFLAVKANEVVLAYYEREFAKICKKDGFKARLVQLSNG